MSHGHRSDARFPNNGLNQDGWSNEDEATATCFCGKVQLVVPLKAPGLKEVFVCNCVDCRKVTASMFATNFTVADSHSRFTRGEDNLSTWGQSQTTSTGKTMTNGFCKTCGTLMYRQGEAFPGTKFLRVGTVDDVTLHNTVFSPQNEYFVEDRPDWLHAANGAKQVHGFFG